MIPAEQLIERICAERQKVNGTPPNLTRARLSLKVGIDLTVPKEFGGDNQIETKIRNAAAALGIFV